MTPTQPPALHDDLRARLLAHVSTLRHLPELARREWKTKIADDIQEAIAALSAPASEAVAYTYRDEVILAKHWTASGPPIGWTPLFTTPQPAPAHAGGQEAVAWEIWRNGKVRASLTRPPMDGEAAYGEGETVRALYTTPPAAIPVDALRELAERWSRMAGYEDEEGEPEQEAGSATRLRICADELTALIAATKEAE